MGYRWVCPECKNRFPAIEGRTPKCPECGYSIENASDDEVVLPFISSARAKSPDAIYRAEERASQHRAEVAAQIVGGSPSDMSAMVMTDQRDNLREGDVSAPRIASDNQVAHAMAAAPRPMPGAAPIVGNAGNEAGLTFSAGVSSGPLPNMGARMQQRIRDIHPTLLGTHAGPIKSDQPANEINNPLYRRRV